jgi:L-threonylcarbamoyladenylate synthase
METIIGTSIQEAANWLKKGELVAIPTETVYGLAANNEAAIIKVFETKKRPSFNPLIVHVKSIADIDQYAYLDEISAKLAEAFMPGPFSLLLPKKSTVSDLITAGSPLVAIRFPKHELFISLLNILPNAIVAPSANMFGYVSPTQAKHVFKGMEGKIPYILDGGPAEVGVESTIVEVNNSEIIIHRNGAITEKEIAIILPSIKITNYSGEKINTPGQIKSHYATSTSLVLVDDAEVAFSKFGNKKLALLLLTKAEWSKNIEHCFELSSNGNLAEAAKNLFDTMQYIDTLDVDMIIAEKLPNVGIGIAINDRLNRAQSIFK